MRPFEIALSVALALAVALLAIAGSAGVFGLAFVVAIAVVLAILHISLEGHRWQMWPEYVLTAGLGALVLARFRPAGQGSLIAATVAGLLLLSAVFLSSALPVPRFPKLSGPYRVGTFLRHVIDPERRCPFANNTEDRRELMLQFWYPTEEAGRSTLANYRDIRGTNFRNSRQALMKARAFRGAPASRSDDTFPVLFYVPSWSGEKWENTFLAEELASEGYVVVGLDHPGISEATVFPDGRVIRRKATPGEDYSSEEALRDFLNAAEEQLKIRTADILSALKAIESGSGIEGSALAAGRLDLTRLGILGFSMGGATAAEVCCLDARFKSGINMDGLMVGQSREQGTRVPFLFLMHDMDLDAAPGDMVSTLTQARRSAFDDGQYRAMKNSLAATGGYWMVIPGTIHSDFSDSRFYSPLRRIWRAQAIDPEQTARTIACCVLAFFEETLRGQPQALLENGSNSYSEVRFESWKPQLRMAASQSS